MAEEVLTTSKIAEIVGGKLVGDRQVRIKSVAPLSAAQADQITFATNDQRVKELAGSKAGAAIVPESVELPEAGMAVIRVADVQAALAKLLAHLALPEDLPAVGIDPGAVIDPAAEIAADARIGPGVVVSARTRIGSRTALMAGVSVGPDVEIGPDTVLCEGVRVRHGCKIGSRVRIGPNSVVGYDGFGYYFADGKHNKIPHAGNVVVEDDVEIGACCCIDRAKFGSTVIGAGSKIDNLVQVAHNVRIGKGCILAGLCGIAGSASLGDYVVLGGHVGIRDNISLGGGVTCGAYTAVAEDVPDGVTMFGIPAVPAWQKLKEILLTRKLPDLVKRIGELEKKLKNLELSKDD